MTDPARPRPPRKTGLAHFLAAATYSAGGLARLWRESAFRQEALAGAAILLGLVALGVAAGDLAVMAILMLAVVAVEALNTAVEELVDHLSPGWSEFAKHAKDLGSLAVMCLLIANGIWLALVVWRWLG
jgi:diacylglycerol kinase (ATP)